MTTSEYAVKLQEIFISFRCLEKKTKVQERNQTWKDQ